MLLGRWSLALLFLSEADPVDQWREALLAEMPDLDFRVWPDQIGNPLDIDVALVWLPPPGELSKFANLKAILSLGAGVDALIEDCTLPNLPLARMVDPSLTRMMADYVLAAALRHHRNLDFFEHEQRSGRWTFKFPKLVGDRTVGILGLGVLGSAAAACLRDFGFKVQGWSRSEKILDGVACFHGSTQLHSFLSNTEILICLLPLTQDTEGVLNTSLFAALPSNACLINVGRGRHLVEGDLIEALENGQLAAATLDVFETEPLPKASRLWNEPRVLVTPHVASYCDPRSAAAGVVENIRLVRAGRPPNHLADRARGY